MATVQIEITGNRGHKHPDRQGTHTVGHTGALSTVHTECTGNQPGEGRLGTEGTDNQTDSGNQSDRGVLGLLYIQRALTTSLGEGRPDTEGTNNQTDRGTKGHCLLYIQPGGGKGGHW